jgi:hypothetical protein
MRIKYSKFAFLCRISIVAMTALTACGSPEPAASEEIGCEAAEHEGLLCHASGAEQVGVCTNGTCKPIPCEVADDCDDRSGNAACRSYTCNAGTCERTNVSEGFACSKPTGETGTCASGICELSPAP